MDLQHASAPILTGARRALIVLVSAVIGFGAFVPVAAASAAVATTVPAAATGAASTTAQPTGDARASSVRGGYQLVASDGGIFSFGAAQFFGSTGALALTRPIVGMAPTASGNGYRLVASDGGVFSFGEAQFFGSTGALALTRPIVGMAPTASGEGYWSVASDGGIFTFGDAKYFGSTGTLALKQPIVGMAVSPSNDGYWLVASDGGIFSFGGAGYFGSADALALNSPVVGMRATEIEVADHALPATQLAFSTQPVDSTGGSSFASQPAVEIQDATGARVMDGTNDVLIRLTTAAGATLACDATDTTAVGGVATFAGCSINHPGTYTLTATSGALDSAVSSSTTITVGVASQLAFTTQPGDSTGGTNFTTQPVVTVQDAGGNTVTGDTSTVALALTTPAGATLACTANPANAAAGVVTFAGCNVDLVGTYTLTATDGVLTAAVSFPLTVTAGPAVALSFVAQPSDSIAGVAFGSQPEVAVLDAGGNTVTTDTTAITLTLTVPGSASLTCTADPVSADAGVATFAGCSVDLANTYSLDASRIGLTSATSDPFVISPGAAAGLEMVTAPTGGVTGADWTIQPVLRFVDSFGNTATSSTDISTIEILFGPTAVNGVECSANPQAAVAGVVTFAHCTINTASAPPSTWSLHFTSMFGSLRAPVTEH